jgi:class 3 adenylate cyclase
MPMFKLAAHNMRVLIMPLLVAALLLGLPIAVWLDLRALTEASLRRQAADFNSLITSVRDYYATNVVGRVLAAGGSTQVVHNYHDVPGAIPIPATLSLELGQVIRKQQKSINYRFVSDYPFLNRARHALDEFEKGALERLRTDPDQFLTEVSNSVFTDNIRLIAPVVMGEACVGCHNTHPESPKRDWKVGDVRGIQEVSVAQPISVNIMSFKYLLIYFVLVAVTGLTFIAIQRRQAAIIKGINQELEAKNTFLAGLSSRISRYLPPQVYQGIFSGEKQMTIHTERKKLTIFFSDIKDFTAITERLQPEQMTRLLNEYFTEMSAIALRYGGTIAKFVGDAILIFFGDPDTKGEEADALACVRMALDMQRGIAELNAKWRNEGIEQPFRVRMGVNTGFCDVGNFGSAERMDYTIIGAEANLAARLQSIADAGQIVISYETYALVKAFVLAQPMAPITMKGISREVVPYVLEGIQDELVKSKVFSEHLVGADFYLDPARVAADTSERLRNVLQEAIAALDKHRDAAGRTHHDEVEPPRASVQVVPGG